LQFNLSMKNPAQHITWLLLVVFGLIITPKELIHEFYGHEDTRCNPGDRATFESLHHHCEILQLTCPSYTSPEKIQLNSIFCSHDEFNGTEIIKTAVPFRVYFNLRAPPLA